LLLEGSGAHNMYLVVLIRVLEDHDGRVSVPAQLAFDYVVLVLMALFGRVYERVGKVLNNLGVRAELDLETFVFF